MILVFGGAGYIGSHTVKHLLDNGYECVVADNLIYGHREAVDKRAEFVHADLLNPISIREVFKSRKIDAVIHFAAFTYVGESVSDPQKYYLNNVVGTTNLLNVMLENGVKKIVFSSTCATYGEPQYTPIDEKHPQNPINPYGRTKLMIEQIFADYERAYGLKHIALRYFNAAGCAQDGSIGESHTPETHLIPLVLKAIKGEREKISVFGTDYDTPDGSCIRDYIYVVDLAKAHVCAMTRIMENESQEPVEVFNIGTGKGTSVLELIHAFENATGVKLNYKIVDRRAGDIEKVWGNVDKANKVLGWKSETPLEDVLASAWKWQCALRERGIM